MVKKVDTTALKFNQASIVALTGLGFVLDQPWLVLLVGLVLALGTIAPGVALFKLVYLKLFRPAGLLKANVIDDDPAPHQFAQGVGALFLLAASAALFLLPGSFVGWVLALMVVVLAAVNLVFNFCAGCFVYYQLDRLGLLPARGK